MSCRGVPWMSSESRIDRDPVGRPVPLGRKVTPDAAAAIAGRVDAGERHDDIAQDLGLGQPSPGAAERWRR